MNLQDLGRILSEPRHRIYIKLAILGLLVAASLLPLQSIRGLIVERQETSRAVEEEIVGSWGGEQRIIGPVLVVPLAGGSTGSDGASPDTETGITYAEEGENSDTEDGENSENNRLFIRLN